MCGICGIVAVSPKVESSPRVEQLWAMMGALRHRGPDGSGYFVDDHAALGHTRLAIVDTANGEQPMCNEDARIWVSYNGEIFNHVELRAQLRDRGHEFRTQCDTEVIVHAWEEWGPDSFNRFNGQWAIALWDRAAENLILCRDRYGVRPLYYTHAAGRFFFASEIKALFAAPEVSREFDPVGLDQTLTFWSPVAPRTPYAGISQVPPGSFLVVGQGSEELVRYWTPEFGEPDRSAAGDLDEQAEGVRERLIEATRLRFERSDVPVGAYLSGGIDSSVTASIIGSLTDVDLHTFSLRFTDKEFDEGSYQRRLVDRLGTNHREIEVSERDIAEVFPEVVWHGEHPLLRTAPAPMFLLSRLVHDCGYKVVVTGEGADEVLAGYDVFREAKVREFWARNPDSAVRSRAVELLYPWMARSPNLAPAFSAGFFGRNLSLNDPALSHRPRWDSTAGLKSMLAEPYRVATPSAAADELLATMPAGSDRWTTLGKAQWLEMSTLLPGYILASQGDRMLMANSVEGRFPFLDVELGRYASELPSQHKILGLDEKHLLKRGFADLVPDEIRHRPKQPYRAPDAASFFAADSPDWVGDVTSADAIEQAGVFRPEIVDRLLTKVRRNQGRGLSNTDNMRLVAVLSTQLLSGQIQQRYDAGAPPVPCGVFDFRTRSRRPS
jgi:asparagine synthase (glutamine-hydrolysing)